MTYLRFGTAGVPLSSSSRNAPNGIQRIREIGLSSMEVEFTHGVYMNETAAREVRSASEDNDVALSVHAPYYINLNSPEAPKIAASKKRIMDSARIGSICGARDIVFHPGFYMKRSREETYGAIRDEMEELAEATRPLGAVLRPETTGKATQFGSLDEILRLSQEIPGVAPCIDFSHLHARRGMMNSYDEFRAVLEDMEDALGREALDDIHCHVSGIEYTPKGEKKHLILEEADFNYTDLLRALKDMQIRGRIICESPNLEEDALLLKRTYDAL